MSLQNLHTHHYAYKGFSLIEAALVLGVVALVIGGLWIAASSVQQARKINEISKDILFIVQGVRSLIPFENYPSSYPSHNSYATTMHNAGLLPKDYILTAPTTTNSFGTEVNIYLSCWSASYPSSNCPMMGILVGNQTDNSASLSQAECNQLIRKVGANYRDDKNFRYAQVVSTSSSNIVSYTPPFAGQNIDCTSAATGVYFWFAPN